MITVMIVTVIITRLWIRIKHRYVVRLALEEDIIVM